MTQNRNKLIELFIENISNAIVHEILERAIDDENIRNHYGKEFGISFDKARSYREKINSPTKLPDHDLVYIKERIIKKVKFELQLRILKGYNNINLNLIEQITDKTLKEMNIL